jgi:alkylated DNA nucleotide flippase Atl1
MHRDRHTPASEAPADRILDHVRAIPKGLVSTYGDINPAAPRRVGRVLATAQPDVPWHRVVRADGTVPMRRSGRHDARPMDSHQRTMKITAVATEHQARGASFTEYQVVRPRAHADPGAHRPGRDWHLRDGRIVELGLHLRARRDRGNDVTIAVRARHSATN